MVYGMIYGMVDGMHGIWHGIWHGMVYGMVYGMAPYNDYDFYSWPDCNRVYILGGGDSQ